MHEPVDEIVMRRKVEPKGLGRVMSASVGVHVGAVLLMFVIPPDWFTTAKAEPILMTISLGGSEGENTGGLVSAGARPVEEVAPPPKRPEPIPPATPPKSSSMAVSTKKPTPTPSKPADTTSTVTRPPTTGAEVTKGTAVADTRSTGQSTGLQVGGGQAGDAGLRIDSTFCCPDYLVEVLARIRRNWNRNQPLSGKTVVVFEIRRDGTFSRPEVEESSGNTLLDIASMSAFEKLVLPRLPAEYTADSLRVHLTFPYVR